MSSEVVPGVEVAESTASVKDENVGTGCAETEMQGPSTAASIEKAVIRTEETPADDCEPRRSKATGRDELYTDFKAGFSVPGPRVQTKDSPSNTLVVFGPCNLHL